MPGERLDVVVFGATGFVGRLVAAYLAEHAPDVRVGLAGRSLDRLERVRAGLGGPAAGWPLLHADTTDAASMSALAAATRVVATTVGPYARYGLPLVEACATAGTHYADLSGEVLFMHDSAQRYHRAAAATGARIVHACGFDSIPSDLGVLLVHEAVRRDGAGELEDTTLVVTEARGGVSGGTLASATAQLDEVRAHPERRRIAADPYALSPDRDAEPDLGRQPDMVRVGYDRYLGTWVAPFVMAAVNTRVVRRSNALQQWAYGRRFRYREALGFGTGRSGAAKATAAALAQGALVVGLGFGPSRRLLDRVLPSPGEGPDERARAAGRFTVEVHTRTSTGARYVARVSAQGDPGYTATSVMLAESALCLAVDHDRLPDRAGVLTPATAMGGALVDRLRAAGFILRAGRQGR